MIYGFKKIIQVLIGSRRIRLLVFHWPNHGARSKI